MDTYRHRILWGFSASILAACSTTVELGPEPDGGTVPSGDAAPDGAAGDAALDDAALDDAAPPEDAGMPESDCPCGLCFEHRAGLGYSDIWVRSPTDIWLVAGGRRVERFDGVSSTPVPLPELSSELSSIVALDGGAGEHPYLALSREGGTHGRIHALYRWTGTEWSDIALPEPLRRSLNGRLSIAPTVDGQVWAALSGLGTEPATAEVFFFDGAEWSGHTFAGEWRVYALSASTERAFVTLMSDHRAIALFENVGDGWHDFPIPSYDPMGGIQVPRIAIGERLYAISGYLHVWDPASDRWELIEGVSARDAGGRGTRQWIIGRHQAYLSTDPTNPLALEAHRLPFKVEAASFSDDGPAWVAGSGLAYWNGARWTTVTAGERLYSLLVGQSGTPVWGTNADDYWIIDRSTRVATHVHDRIAEQIALARPFLSSAHGLDEDDVFFLSSSEVLRVVGREVVETHAIPDGWAVRGSTRLWGTDEDHLWLSTPNGVLRYRDGVFVPELTPDPDHWAAPITFVGGRSERDVWALTQTGAVYHYDGTTWSAMPDIPLRPEGAPASVLLEAHVGATGLWVLTKVQAGGTMASFQVWSHRSGAWERTALFSGAARLEADLFGRGDEVRVLTEDRVLFRRQDDDTWARDDRCRDASELRDIELAAGWFPPGDAPPKIFGVSGNVLVEQEPE